MSWNYRVIRRIEEQHTSVEPVFVIAEVYYDESNNVIRFSADAIYPVGDTADELRADLERMLEAFKKPILDQRPDGWLNQISPDGESVPILKPA